jgi:glycerol-3-phosphate dehydrogenase
VPVCSGCYFKRTESGFTGTERFCKCYSGASSKLIHGGLRYLINLEIGLVRESLKERRICLKLHLI